jgi:hypothetical protein
MKKIVSSSKTNPNFILMNFAIPIQLTYSRLELIIRVLFGSIYIGIPHGFLLALLSLWGLLLNIIAFFSILFKGNYPSSLFDYQAQLIRWDLRVDARLLHLADGYPPFGLTATDEAVVFEVKAPPETSRLLTLIRFFLGWLYVGIPHYFILFFRTLWGVILSFFAFWNVLFTKRYPVNWHRFWVENLRWSTRVKLYLSFMSEEYPPFHGKA